MGEGIGPQNMTKKGRKRKSHQKALAFGEDGLYRLWEGLEKLSWDTAEVKLLHLTKILFSSNSYPVALIPNL